MLRRLFSCLAVLGVSAISFGQTANPSIAKSFSPSAMIVNGTSTLTFTITAGNANLTTLTFSDSFPAGVQVAASPGLATTCVAGTTVVGGNAGSTNISVTIPSLAANASCTFSVDVTGTTAGTKVNTSSAITAQVADGGPVTGNAATATLLVVTPPTLAKTFGTANLQVGSSTTLTFTLTNPAGNPTPFTNLSFTDTLPAGLAIALPSGLASNCGGIVSATSPGTINQAGGSLAPGASCTISLNVTGIAAGIQNNVTSTLTDAEGVVGAAATATVTVVSPPTITKAFADSQLQLFGPGNTTALSFTVSNPNTTALTGIAFLDTLPAGLIVSTPSVVAGTCDGGTITATAGSNTIALSGATLAGGASCTFSVNVTATQIGVQVNTTSAITAFGGTVVGNTATATIEVNDLFFYWFFAESGGGSRP